MFHFISRRGRLFTINDPRVRGIVRGASAVVSRVAIGYFCYKSVTTSCGWISTISGKSMQPTLNPSMVGKVEDLTWRQKWIWSDWVWINCWHRVGRGDLLVYVSPKNPEELLIKRVIATAGDIVETNGRGDYPIPRVRIPLGHVWVQGDNRAVSVDSNK